MPMAVFSLVHHPKIFRMLLRILFADATFRYLITQRISVVSRAVASFAGSGQRCSYCAPFNKKLRFRYKFCRFFRVLASYGSGRIPSLRCTAFKSLGVPRSSNQNVDLCLKGKYSFALLVQSMLSIQQTCTDYRAVYVFFLNIP